MSIKRAARKPPRPRMVTKAARKLKRFLARTGGSVAGFAKEAGVERVTLHRLLNGERYELIAVDFVIGVIREASKRGLRLSLDDFASSTAQPPDGDEDEPFGSKATGTSG